MTFDPDIADDCTLVDGLETVTVVGATTLTVSGAKRSPLSIAEAKLQREVLGAADLTWLLPEANLAGLTPRIGDTITDSASVSWTIVNVHYSPLTQVWRALGLRQR